MNLPPSYQLYDKFRPFFRSIHEAQNWNNRVRRSSPQKDSLKGVVGREMEWIERVYNCMINTHNVRDRTTSVAYRRFCIERHYTEIDLVASAWIIVHECLDLYKRGCCLPEELDYTRVSSVDKNLTCAQRLDAICNALYYEKSICRDVMDGTKLRVFINAPIESSKRKHGNRRTNDAKRVRLEKAKKIQTWEDEQQSAGVTPLSPHTRGSRNQELLNMTMFLSESAHESDMIDAEEVSSPEPKSTETCWLANSHCYEINDFSTPAGKIFSSPSNPSHTANAYTTSYTAETSLYMPNTTNTPGEYRGASLRSDDFVSPNSSVPYTEKSVKVSPRDCAVGLTSSNINTRNSSTLWSPTSSNVSSANCSRSCSSSSGVCNTHDDAITRKVQATGTTSLSSLINSVTNVNQSSDLTGDTAHETTHSVVKSAAAAMLANNDITHLLNTCSTASSPTISALCSSPSPPMTSPSSANTSLTPITPVTSHEPPQSQSTHQSQNHPPRSPVLSRLLSTQSSVTAPVPISQQQRGSECAMSHAISTPNAGSQVAAAALMPVYSSREFLCSPPYTQ